MLQTCTGQGGFSCADCMVGQRSDWSDLDQDTSDLLQRGRHRQQYSSGEIIFAQGEPNDGVYCVSVGTAAIRKLDESGNSVILQLAYPGDTIGFHSFLTGTKHRTNAEALGDCALCHFDSATINVALTRDPTLGRHFLKRSIAELDFARDMLFRQATLSNRGKVVHLLLLLAKRHGRRHTDGSHSIDLPISRHDLAAMVGMRPESISRIISRLESAGLAEFSGRHVTIPRIEALAAEID